VTFKVSVNKIGSQVKSFGNKFEFEVDLHKPIDKDGAHTFINMGLVFHVERTDRGKSLPSTKVFVHILDVISSAKRIIGIPFIDIVCWPILVIR
jgi:hypothetical protein